MKDMSSIQSMFGGSSNSTAATARKPGSNMGGNSNNGVTYSKYLSASPGGATETDRNGFNTVNPYGNMMNYGMPMMGYGGMGGFGGGQMNMFGFPSGGYNAMNNWGSKYGGGGQGGGNIPAWAPKPEQPKPSTPIENTQPIPRTGCSTGDEALGALNSGLTRGLQQDEINFLKDKLGYSSGEFSTDQMQKAKDLIKQYKPELLQGGIMEKSPMVNGMGGF